MLRLDSRFECQRVSSLVESQEAEPVAIDRMPVLEDRFGVLLVEISFNRASNVDVFVN